MGIEAGPSGVVVGSPHSFEAAPAGIGSFGPKFESLSYSPIDSPVGKGDLENMVPYKVGMFDSAGSINFTSEPRDPLITPELGVQPLKSGWVAIPDADIVQAHRTKAALIEAGLVDLSKAVDTHLQPEVRKTAKKLLRILFRLR